MVIWDDLIDGDLMMRMIFNFHDFMGLRWFKDDWMGIHLDLSGFNEVRYEDIKKWFMVI